MPKKTAIIISPNYKDYAKKYLSECIDSVRKQDYNGETKIFITDNETSLESFQLLSKTAPEAELILNKNNDGFAKGNNDAMRLAITQGFDYIILFNMDTVIGSDCVRKMVEAAEGGDINGSGDTTRLHSPLLFKKKARGLWGQREIGAVQARLMLWPEKEKINSLGNITHFLGFGYAKGYNSQFIPPAGGPNSQFLIQDICYPSGAAVLFKTDILKEIGLFDEEFWMYNEDQDLGWRIWLAGYKCVLAPDAVVYHKYEFSRSIKKYYWMDRNRIIVMLKNYHWLTLILVTPACLIMEFGLLLFSLRTGWFNEKLRVYKYFLTLKKWKYIMHARQKAQKLRKLRDKYIAGMFAGRIWYQEVDDIKLRIINPVFSAYWNVIKKIMIW